MGDWRRKHAHRNRFSNALGEASSKACVEPDPQKNRNDRNVEWFVGHQTCRDRRVVLELPTASAEQGEERVERQRICETGASNLLDKTYCDH